MTKHEDTRQIKATGRAETAYTQSNMLTYHMVYTAHGIVIVIVGYGQTILHFVHNGQERRRYYDTVHTRRWCVTLAKRFAAEVAEVSSE